MLLPLLRCFMPDLIGTRQSQLANNWKNWDKANSFSLTHIYCFFMKQYYFLNFVLKKTLIVEK